MADTALRYLEMLQHIPRYPHGISTVELREKLADVGFDINVRSIQRDLEKLSATFPLISDDTVRPYRWSFDAGASAKMLPTLDMSTALTFELTHAYLTPILPPKVLAHLEPHFREARAVLSRNGNPLAHWPEKIRQISRGLVGCRPDIKAEVLEKLTQALLDEQQCLITYMARSWKKPEQVTIHPLGMVSRDPNTYLIATIDGREGVRQLAMHRISQVDVLQQSITKPDGFNLDLFIESGAMHVLNSTNPVELHIRCDKPMLMQLLESPLEDGQKVLNETDNNFDLLVTLPDSQDLRWWLLAQSPYLDIISPIWLKQEITDTLQKAINRYQT